MAVARPFGCNGKGQVRPEGIWHPGEGDSIITGTDSWGAEWVTQLSHGDTDGEEDIIIPRDVRIGMISVVHEEEEEDMITE